MKFFIMVFLILEVKLIFNVLKILDLRISSDFCSFSFNFYDVQFED